MAQAQPTVMLSVPFESLLGAIQQLSLEDKYRLAAELDRQILHAEEELWGQDPEEEAEVEQARKEYEAGDYVTFDEYNARRRGR